MEKSFAVVGCTMAALSTGVAGWALYKWCSLRRYIDTQHKYFSQQEVQKQLIHHYVNIDNLAHLKELIPSSADAYPGRLAEFCSYMCDKYQNTKCRVLDVGSGVGGTAFHLSKFFDEVVGTDISVDMILASHQLQQFSEYASPLSSEGGKHIKMYKVKIPDGCDRNKVTFLTSDVHSTLNDYSMFDCILLSNVLTDLISPKDFLKSLCQHVPVNGLLIIADPFLWPNGPEDKLGGDGTVKTSTLLNSILDPEWTRKETAAMPFYIAQSERVAQVASAEVSVWQRLQDLDSSDDTI